MQKEASTVYILSVFNSSLFFLGVQGPHFPYSPECIIIPLFNAANHSLIPIYCKQDLSIGFVAAKFNRYIDKAKLKVKDHNYNGALKYYKKAAEISSSKKLASKIAKLEVSLK